MKNALLVLTIFVLGVGLGIVAAQPNRKEEEGRIAQQFRDLAVVAVVSQKEEPEAAARMLAALAELSIVRVSEPTKKDIVATFMAFVRLSELPRIDFSQNASFPPVEEEQIRIRMEEFEKVQRVAREAIQPSETTRGK